VVVLEELSALDGDPVIGRAVVNAMERGRSAHTVPVKDAPGAECVTVTDGKITSSRLVFDQAPFDAAQKAAS
jgi:hypothetical protein